MALLKFSVPLRKIAEAMLEDVERGARAIAFEVFQRIVYRSPVGNPDLWEVNQVAFRYNTDVANYNSDLRLDPANLDKAGRLKRGLKIHDGMRYSAGEGYIGGHFRNNWQIMIGAESWKEESGEDQVGTATVARGAQSLAKYKLGQKIKISNNLVYAVRLELGHSSKQAPAGMVRITLMELPQIARDVTQVIRAAPKRI